MPPFFRGSVDRKRSVTFLTCNWVFSLFPIVEMVNIKKTMNHSVLNRKTDCYTGQKPSVRRTSVPVYSIQIHTLGYCKGSEAGKMEQAPSIII